MASDDKIILTAEEAISLLPEGEHIHNYINNVAGMFIGCDYTRESAEQHIRAAAACEIGGENCKRMKHALVVWSSADSLSFFATDPAKVEAMEQAKETADV
jgi:hypothetical protein